MSVCVCVCVLVLESEIKWWVVWNKKQIRNSWLGTGTALSISFLISSDTNPYFIKLPLSLSLHVFKDCYKLISNPSRSYFKWIRVGEIWLEVCDHGQCRLMETRRRWQRVNEWIYNVRDYGREGENQANLRMVEMLSFDVWCRECNHFLRWLGFPVGFMSWNLYRLPANTSISRAYNSFRVNVSRGG